MDCALASRPATLGSILGMPILHFHVADISHRFWLVYEGRSYGLLVEQLMIDRNLLYMMVC